MDRTLANLRRAYTTEPVHNNAMRWAGALLRIADLDHYIQRATEGDDEIAGLLNYMRAIYLFEDIFDELYEQHGRVYFTDPENRNIKKYKYANVYCFGRPLASIRVYNFDEALRAKRFLEVHFKQELLMPPEQMWLDRGMAQLMGEEHMLAAYPYSDGWCIEPTRALLEDEPPFDFSRSDAPPEEPEFSHGTRFFQSRPLAEDDFTTVDTDFSVYTTIRDYEYSDLPEFAKPDASFLVPEKHEPAYAVASLVTRHEVRAIDGSAWENYHEPIAKIYLGYIFPYWIPDGTISWHWTERMYVNMCVQDQIAADARLTSAIEQEAQVHERELHPCDLARVPQIEDRIRDRCHHCGNDMQTQLHQPSQLEKNEDADEGVPNVPESVNVTLAFLQEMYISEIWGDIYSVLEGQTLSVHTQQGGYGPDDTPK